MGQHDESHRTQTRVFTSRFRWISTLIKRNPYFQIYPSGQGTKHMNVI